MQRLLLEGTARVRWEEASEPALAGPYGAIVRPVAVATCDLDVAVLRGRYPLAGPYPFGHEAVADVVEVGTGVVSRGFDPSAVISAVVTRAEAAEALARPPMKLVITCTEGA